MITRTLTAALLAVTLVVPFALTDAQAGQKSRGSFVGENNHTVSGGVAIVRHEDWFAVKLGRDFFLDGAPDPKVGFGQDGRFVDGTLIGALQANTGAQLFPIPAGMDVSDFDTIFIWCEKFSVSLGKATLR